MQKIFRVDMGDGYVKDFTNEDEANAKEAEIALKKAEEDQLRQARLKAIKERKEKEEAEKREKLIYINSLRNEIERQSKELLDNIKKYDEHGGEKRVDAELSLFGLSYYRYFGDNSKELVRYLCNTVLCKTV